MAMPSAFTQISARQACCRWSDGGKADWLTSSKERTAADCAAQCLLNGECSFFSHTTKHLSCMLCVACRLPGGVGHYTSWQHRERSAAANGTLRSRRTPARSSMDGTRPRLHQAAPALVVMPSPLAIASERIGSEAIASMANTSEGITAAEYATFTRMAGNGTACNQAILALSGNEGYFGHRFSALLFALDAANAVGARFAIEDNYFDVCHSLDAERVRTQLWDFIGVDSPRGDLYLSERSDSACRPSRPLHDLAARRDEPWPWAAFGFPKLSSFVPESRRSVTLVEPRAIPSWLSVFGAGLAVANGHYALEANTFNGRPRWARKSETHSKSRCFITFYRRAMSGDSSGEFKLGPDKLTGWCIVCDKERKYTGCHDESPLTCARAWRANPLAHGSRGLAPMPSAVEPGRQPLPDATLRYVNFWKEIYLARRLQCDRRSVHRVSTGSRDCSHGWYCHAHLPGAWDRSTQSEPFLRAVAPLRGLKAPTDAAAGDPLAVVWHVRTGDDSSTASDGSLSRLYMRVFQVAWNALALQRQARHIVVTANATQLREQFPTFGQLANALVCSSSDPDDFIRMVTADILITTGSSFSLAAAACAATGRQMQCVAERLRSCNAQLPTLLRSALSMPAMTCTVFSSLRRKCVLPLRAMQHSQGTASRTTPPSRHTSLDATRCQWMETGRSSPSTKRSCWRCCVASQAGRWRHKTSRCSTLSHGSMCRPPASQGTTWSCSELNQNPRRTIRMGMTKPAVRATRGRFGRSNSAA